MKITGTRSYIDVVIDEKEIRIFGEMIVGGFVAYKDSIKVWDKPTGETIDEDTKNDIIRKVTEKTKNSHMVIVFE
ncbi:Imm74 family immunity protein [Cohnella sp. GCM10027633]|uniref:Imm74 family immunity protein n=1 Tax=unclassified Cohnella TaxID=2636738 RepID=UPI003641658D